ncbi:DNA polymerase [Salinivibrio kushneri]|uniref:DNA polymerase n=1 Tax=Salinivibrio kushneri TaxID=1908198 RepID=UPI00241184BD|nr:DNA polymerase [Salinivibrio kushneri]
METNGLLDTVSLFHCAVTENVVTGEVKKYRPNDYHELLKDLFEADVLVAHNGINYDVPALQKLFPFWDIPETKVIDTLVLSRLVFSNVKDRDVIGIRRWRQWEEYERRLAEGFETPKPKGWTLPPYLYGSHSLKAWGYRLGELKGEYGEQEAAWDEFSEDMLEYCVQDVTVTVKLLKRLYKENYSDKAIQLELETAWLMSKQERNGFKFDTKAAEELYMMLLGKRENLRLKLVETFGEWYVANGVTNPKRSMNRQGFSYTQGAPYTKIKLKTFNPASRQDCAKVLSEKGWKPTVFTETGQAKIDDETLQGTGFPEGELLREFFMLNKRISQLAEGKQAWLRHVTKAGFLHGRVNPNGAVTGRATHSNPNVAQVPSTGAEYGHECRRLFTVPDGWVLMGSDASGLELRCLGHYMAYWDGGAYIKEVLEGDVHWRNAQAAGFIEEGTIRDHDNPQHEEARAKAKRFIYAFLYGAGDELIGGLVGYTQAEYAKWKEKGAHKKVIASLERRGIRWTREMVCQILKGKEVKKKLLDGLPALNDLIEWCKKKSRTDGYMVGLDGRKVYCRSEHSALNTLLQSAGALICKAWCVVVDRVMKNEGYEHDWDGHYAYCAWVHDEIQVACTDRTVAKAMGEICDIAIKHVEKSFEFNCELAADFDIGQSWEDTH